MTRPDGKHRAQKKDPNAREAGKRQEKEAAQIKEALTKAARLLTTRRVR